MLKIRLMIFTVVFFKAYLCIDESTTKNSQDFNEDPALNYKIKLIFPGTKWCGAGNRAKNYFDLGRHRETDKCCRAHDHCDDIIGARETKYNLTNTAPYTRLNCECDDEFYDCLKSVNKRSSKFVGSVYFNTLHTMCFKKEYQVDKCLEKVGLLRRKCLKYGFDTNSEKTYQWFDVQQF